MRGGLVAAAAMVATLLVAVPVGTASAPRIDARSMKLDASPQVAGAHRVRLTVTLTYEMQCGYPGAGPLVVTFPSAMRPPRRFAAGSVKLAGKAIAAKVKGRRVTVTVAPHDGVLCGTIGPGRVALTFTRAARLANPAHAGSYTFAAAHAHHAFRAKLLVKRAA